MPSPSGFAGQAKRKGLCAVMRCPDCAKMVSFSDDGEPEIESCEVDDTGHVTVSARVVRCCADCGNELAEASIEAEGQVDVTGHEGEGHELEVECDNASMTEHSQTVDRHGKPIKNPRYAKRFIGFETTARVKCSCGEKGETEVGECEISGSEQASSFESLV